MCVCVCTHASFDSAIQGIGICPKEVICKLLYERQCNTAVKRDSDTKLWSSVSLSVNEGKNSTPWSCCGVHNILKMP